MRRRATAARELPVAQCFLRFGSVLMAAAHSTPVGHIPLARMAIGAPLLLIDRGKIMNPMNPLAARFVSAVSFRGNPRYRAGKSAEEEDLR